MKQLLIFARCSKIHRNFYLKLAPQASVCWPPIERAVRGVEAAAAPIPFLHFYSSSIHKPSRVLQRGTQISPSEWSVVAVRRRRPGLPLVRAPNPNVSRGFRVYSSCPCIEFTPVLSANVSDSSLDFSGLSPQVFDLSANFFDLSSKMMA